MPLGDEFSTSKEQLLARIDVCMGGKVAEELIMGTDKVGSQPAAPVNYQRFRMSPGCKTRWQERALCQFHNLHIGLCNGLQTRVAEEVRIGTDSVGYKPRPHELMDGARYLKLQGKGGKVASRVPTRLEANACVHPAAGGLVAMPVLHVYNGPVSETERPSCSWLRPFACLKLSSACRNRQISIVRTL